MGNAVARRFTTRILSCERDLMGTACVVVLLGAWAVGEVGIEDILSGIRDREAAVTSFSVHYEIESVLSLDGTGSPLTVWKGTCTCDNSGRYRIQGDRRSGNQAPVCYEQVFDGRARYDASGERGELRTGMVGSSSTPFILPISPLGLAWQFGEGLSASRFFSDRQSHRSGETLWEDRPGDARNVWIIETPEEQGGDGIVRKAQVYVDHARGCTVVRKAMLARRVGAVDWVENWRWEMRDHAEAAPGLWFPRISEHVIFYVLPDNHTSAAQQLKCRFSGWTLNSDLTDATFAFAFPSGVAVNEEATGKVYVSGTINDPIIAMQVEESRRLLEERFHAGWIAIAALAAILVAWPLYLRWRRGRQTGIY